MQVQVRRNSRVGGFFILLVALAGLGVPEARSAVRGDFNDDGYRYSRLGRRVRTTPPGATTRTAR